MHCLFINCPDSCNSTFYSPLCDCLSFQVADDCAVPLYVIYDLAIPWATKERWALFPLSRHTMILNLQQSNYWGVLESEEYRDRFDHHLPAPPIWRGLFYVSFQVLRRWRLNNLSEKHCLIKKSL